MLGSKSPELISDVEGIPDQKETSGSSQSLKADKSLDSSNTDGQSLESTNDEAIVPTKLIEGFLGTCQDELTRISKELSDLT